jgi:hypothetical protein
MSPAEITQQLGLQSLTRRAWVSLISSPHYYSFDISLLHPRFVFAIHVANSSPLFPVHPIYLRHHW